MTAFTSRHAAALLAVAAASAPARAGSRTIDAFGYADGAAAARAWRAGAGAQPPRVGAGPGGGIVLPCPFGRQPGADRFFWDRPVRLDLSAESGIDIELACDEPAALRALRLYFKSGDGWYVFGAPLRKAGRQVLAFPRAAAAREGRPAGWDRIERVRISPWRGDGRDTEVRVYALGARRDAVLVVRGTVSAPEGPERRAAEGAADRVGRWLTDLHVPHGLLEDGEVTDRALAGAKLVLLPYNPVLPDAERAALARFVAAGGRLLVFYSADPQLAALMGFRLGPYRHDPTGRRWNAIRFEEPAAWGVPARVLQQSTSVRPVTPAGRGARVVAWWESADGTRPGEPALAASDAGAWMTHVLLEGDTARKRRMLTALVAHHAPGVWPRVTAPLLEEAARIDSFAGYDEAVAGIRRLAPDAARRREADAHLARAAAARDALREAVAAGADAAALGQAGRLRAALTRAYAVVQPNVPGEFRGVWDHDGVGLFPGEWDRTARLLAAHGMTAVLPNLQWPGLAHYSSDHAESSFSFRRYGDQAAACLAAARRYGLEVHAWKVCWSLAATPDALRARWRREGRLQRDAGGAEQPWLCPSHPGNVRMELAALRELAARYALDGIHLDYLRFPGPDACFCPVTRSAFERHLGRRAAPWPAAVRGDGPLAPAFAAWRRGEITGFLRRARAEVSAARPGIRLSAAVFAAYPGCADSVGQDWGAWLREGLVDFVCPMAYTENLSAFSGDARRFAALPGAAGRVFAGIGVTANTSHLEADQVLEQVAALRAAGLRGFTLFQLDLELRDQVLPMLGAGATRRPGPRLPPGAFDAPR